MIFKIDLPDLVYKDAKNQLELYGITPERKCLIYLREWALEWRESMARKKLGENISNLINKSDLIDEVKNAD